MKSLMDTPDDQTVCEICLFGLDCQNYLMELWAYQGDQNIWIRVSPFLFASTSSALSRNPLKGFVLLENKSIDWMIYFNFLLGTLVWPWGNGLVELPIGRPQSRRAAFQAVHKLSWSKTNERSSPPPSRLMSQSSDRIRNASIFGELPKLAEKQIAANISLHELVFAQVNYPPSWQPIFTKIQAQCLVMHVEPQKWRQINQVLGKGTWVAKPCLGLMSSSQADSGEPLLKLSTDKECRSRNTKDNLGD